MRAARASGATIRLLREGEIPAAEQIYREAFSAHLGIPDPSDFTPGAELIGFRWRKDPARVYAAERDGELVGSNVATNWGSVGVFGPLTVRPELWNAGIGRQLVDAAVTGLEDSGCRHLVLFTFAESAKHVALYQRYGYWPRFLTAIAARSVEEPSLARGSSVGYATVPPAGRRELLAGCRDLTEAVYGGLDLSPEIELTRLPSAMSGRDPRLRRGRRSSSSLRLVPGEAPVSASIGSSPPARSTRPPGERRPWWQA
jgi:predicted N-acetyltransferase YhbS